MNPQQYTMNDDHGDRFPGALPVPSAAPRRADAADRVVRMHAAYVHKVNSVVEAGRDELADELAEAFAQESAASPRTAAGGRRPGAGRGTPARSGTGGPASQAPSQSGRVRTLVRRFDRLTRDVFDAGTPARPID